MEATRPNPQKNNTNPNVYMFLRAEEYKTDVLTPLQKLSLDVKSHKILIDGKEVEFKRHENSDKSIGGFVGPNARARDNSHIGPYVVVADESIVSNNADLKGNVILRDFSRVDSDAKIIGTSKIKPLVLRDNVHVTGKAALSGAGDITDHTVISTSLTVFK